MAQPKTIEVIVDPEGGSRHLIEEEDAAALSGFGEVVDIYRNSHVESSSSLPQDAKRWLMRREINSGQPAYATKWWAAMIPVNGPVLGPFDTRSQALDAEVGWLKENNLPEPQ